MILVLTSPFMVWPSVTDHDAIIGGRISDRQVVTYGFNAQADVRAVNLTYSGGSAHFDVKFQRMERHSWPAPAHDGGSQCVKRPVCNCRCTAEREEAEIKSAMKTSEGSIAALPKWVRWMASPSLMVRSHPLKSPRCSRPHVRHPMAV